MRLRRALPERAGRRARGHRLEVGRMQRGPGLRHGVRPQVPGRPGVRHQRSQEPDEFAQQQGRQKGTRTSKTISSMS